MEQELAEERVAAEAEAKRAQEAIQAKQQELQQIEQQRQHEVRPAPAYRPVITCVCMLACNCNYNYGRKATGIQMQQCDKHCLCCLQALFDSTSLFCQVADKVFCLHGCTGR